MNRHGFCVALIFVLSFTIRSHADEDTIAALVQSLNSDRKFVQLSAAWRLASMRHDAATAVPELIARTNDNDGEIRAAMLNALQSIGRPHEEIVPVLLKAFKDADPRVRRVAAQSINRFRHPGEMIFPVLIEALNDDDAFVRQSVAHALFYIDTRKLPDAADTIKSKGQTLLKDKNDLVRATAAGLLGKFGHASQESLEVLTSLTTHDEREVRRLAVEGLRQSGELAVASFPAIVDRLADPDMHARVRAAHALVSIDKDQGIQTLIKTLSSHNPHHRRTAADGLGSIARDSQDAANALYRFIRHGDMDFRYRVIRAIGNMTVFHPQAVESLTHVLMNDQSTIVRRTAAQTLGRIGPAAAKAKAALGAASQSNDRVLRTAAAQALIAIVLTE